MLFFVRNFSPKIARKASIYKALRHFCVIITQASILRTIPVAFIYKSPLIQIVILLFVTRRNLYCTDLLFKYVIIHIYCFCRVISNCMKLLTSILQSCQTYSFFKSFHKVNIIRKSARVGNQTDR